MSSIFTILIVCFVLFLKILPAEICRSFVLFIIPKGKSSQSCLCLFLICLLFSFLFLSKLLAHNIHIGFSSKKTFHSKHEHFRFKLEFNIRVFMGDICGKIFTMCGGRTSGGGNPKDAGIFLCRCARSHCCTFSYWLRAGNSKFF